VKAVQLIANGAPGKFELRDLPDPMPAADEVVVQVQSCGLNHLDLWLEQGALPIPVPLPRTPGGEVSGRIVDVGAAVTGGAVMPWRCSPICSAGNVNFACAATMQCVCAGSCWGCNAMAVSRKK
jgi:NADPH:quinone reductase-like Zn-dependent oxidoreductase